MNRRMIAEYLKTMIFAILTSVVLTLLLCFFLFFNGKAVDGDRPEYLIHSIGQSVHVEDDEGENVSVDEAAIESLRKYKAWLQVIDADGQVIHGEFVPADIPTQYTMVQLVDGVMRSDRIPGYTLFVGGVPEHPELAVIIGCDSELISKFSIELEGGGDSVLVRCLIIFLLTSVCVIIFAALRFAKKVTVPVTTVIDNIGQISKGQFVENKAPNPLFGEVFSQLDRLQDELQENERTRAEWISNISHDIKTPLSTVKGYSEMLSSEDYEFEPAEVRAYAGEICNAEGVIEGLVEDLRISQMLVEGKLRINKEDVKLHELLEECVEASYPVRRTRMRLYSRVRRISCSPVIGS